MPFTVNIISGTISSSYVFYFASFLTMGAFKFLLKRSGIPLFPAAKMLSFPLTFLFSDILLLLMVKTLNISTSSYDFL